MNPQLLRRRQMLCQPLQSGPNVFGRASLDRSRDGIIPTVWAMWCQRYNPIPLADSGLFNGLRGIQIKKIFPCGNSRIGLRAGAP
jgi:hypothetical protein